MPRASGCTSHSRLLPAYSASAGEFDQLENLHNEQRYIQIKNKILMPLYQDIKSIIKHIKNTPQRRLQREFEVNLALLQKEQRSAEEVAKYQQAYASLLEKVNEQQNAKRIETLHKEVVNIYNLLNLWGQYTDVLKMSNTMTEEFHNQQLAEQRPLQNAQEASAE